MKFYNSFYTSGAFLAGTFFGLVVLGVAIFGITQLGKIKETSKTEKVAVVSPVGEEKPTPSPKIQEQKEPLISRRQIVEQLNQKLYQEGIDIETSVGKIYPGIGFVVTDETGIEVFVYWEGDSPKVGEPVSLLGTIEEASKETIDELKKNPEFTLELEDFLENQRIIIEAKAVNQKADEPDQSEMKRGDL